jgi:hypothetical protein
MCVIAVANVYAQGPSQAETKMAEIVKRYDAVKGVDCLTVSKGSGLGLVKMMLNQQFGKEFMKGVTSITVINYSDASQETCQALRNEIDSFASLLQEFNMGGEKELSEYSYIRSYAAMSGERILSDFLVAMENKEVRTVIYMSGKIKAE